MKHSLLTIFGDGGSRGNPGEAAYGFAVFDESGNNIYKEGRRLGVATNNFAEYSAVISALDWVVRNHPTVEVIQFKLDSLLIASQMSGKFKIKHPSMRELYLKAKALEEKVGAKIIYAQIPREQNKVADGMVNEALDYKI